ncbi:MAG: 4-hydroxy-3-methylbut-2-enyl diphosphate reductase [Opitutales bacterium]|nr:4-hydroxy-3-methylbut-2-enyl diphosphate reductase [Opitutales bacterium]NRA27966.1 4-hydroxy-3-methylbut-2-enyl diphosphate reductase [Opitutales bacterium]
MATSSATLPVSTVVLFNWQNRIILHWNDAAAVWGFWDATELNCKQDRREAWRALNDLRLHVADEQTGLGFARFDEPDAERDTLTGKRLKVLSFQSLSDILASTPDRYASEVGEYLELINASLDEVPYINFGRHDFIYRFRTEASRNRDAYRIDGDSAKLYQSKLCFLIKQVRRKKENSASEPAVLDFGSVAYVIPSHFGFCLGVQNAIERAYETLSKHPEQRVFMLSELIHNPFVNQDLRRRGLLYLQSDKGKAVLDPETGKPYWDTLSEEDVVVIPAFGATREDKRRLIALGLPLNEYDATCMLVEKVWKAASRFAESGYTVIVHGKAEHEETKATFSHAAHCGPSVIIRDRKEAQILAEVMQTTDLGRKQKLFEPFRDRCTEGFDVNVDLERIAVVNQTTLLRNETLYIINLLHHTLVNLYGEEETKERIAGRGQGDTLCYATQVNQDALGTAIQAEVDFAFVVGGKNSSNTYQLYRMCAEYLGERAYFIQNEENVSEDFVSHYAFPQNPGDPKQGTSYDCPFDWSHIDGPVRILVTGGASCPDGIIQQVIFKVNQIIGKERSLKPVEAVIDALN